MPIGVIVNALSVVVGSVFGTGVGKKLSEDFKTKLNMILSCCSFAMGISSICLMNLSGINITFQRILARKKRCMANRKIN